MRAVNVFAILMVALLGVSVSYALFMEKTYVYTTVSTGTVAVEWLVDEQGRLCMHGFLVPQGVSVSGYRGPNYVYEATVTVGNFYAGAKGILGLAIKNTGSLPVKIKSMRIDVTSDTGNLTSVIYFGIPGVNVDAPNKWATSWNNVVYFKNTLRAWNGYELDYASHGVPQVVFAPGDWYAVYAYLEMDAAAESGFEGASVSFKITLNVVQAV
ncbi:MAG: hypothetical protein RMJ03_03465 [Nitrososphaerota archaeon]|nr:hypothetical protein [Nitrososphaerota archaeon]